MNLSVSFSPILWSSQTGDRAQEYFTKLGYRSDMKIKKKEFVKWNAKLIIMWLKDCENKCEIKILIYKSGHKFLQPAISICSVAAKVASSSSCSNSKQQFAEIQASCSCSRLIAAAAAQLHEQCYTGPTNFCCSTDQQSKDLLAAATHQTTSSTSSTSSSCT
jgi:hypothetical protein